MEFFSTSQLQKYEGIIQKIKCEFEKYELLKKDLQKENDNLVISQLANSAITQKLAHLNIQIFGNLTDLLHLYGEELQSDLSSMSKFGHYKFYLIEVYITKSLMQKAKGLKCMLHVIVKTENVNINKTVILRNKTPLREIMLVDSNIINSTVEASLLVPSEFKWMIIKLDTVFVDMSYHFQIYNERLKPECKVTNILHITKCYNKSVTDLDLHKPVTLETKLFCNVEKECFISTMLKNCYHSLDVELFLEFKNDTDKEFILKLSNGTTTFNLKFNMREKYLKLEANVHDLCFLKKYFCKEFNPNAKLHTSSASDILKVLKINENVSQIPQEACASFCEVRNSWSKLPI